MRSYTIAAFVASTLIWSTTASAQEYEYRVKGKTAKDQAAGQRLYEREQAAMKQGDNSRMKDVQKRYYEESSGYYRGGLEEAAVGVNVGGGSTRRAELPTEPEELYSGIIPGTRDDVTHIEAKKPSTKRSRIRWIGFLPQDTRTRVFVQVDADADYDLAISKDGASVLITFPSTKLDNPNLKRDIDARFFGRDVTYIDVSRRKGSVTLEMKIKPGATPRASREGDYVYFDFPHTPETGEATRSED